MSLGGIQRAGRHTCAVLTALARDQGLSCRLFSLNDPPGRHQLQVGDLLLTIQGFGRGKIQFALSVLAAAPQVRMAYINHPHLAPLGLLFRLLRPGARYSVAAHGTDVWERLSLVRRLGLRLADAVTAPSQDTAGKIVELQKVNHEKVKVLPWGLDSSFLTTNGAATRSKPVFPSGKMLLTVARLAASERYKGVQTVIEALPIVLRVVPHIYYVIVGHGDDRPRLKRLAKDMGVASHVLFVGEKSDDEVASYYAACDVFVMPSRQEGFGLVFLEAMAFGKAIISSNHGGTPEVVIDGQTGFLVQYGDVDILADRIICLLQDEELRNQMGEAGRHRVLENYTFEHFRHRLVQLLTGDERCGS